MLKVFLTRRTARALPSRPAVASTAVLLLGLSGQLFIISQPLAAVAVLLGGALLIAGTELARRRMKEASSLPVGPRQHLSKLTPPSVWNVPTHPLPFTGREVELGNLDRLFGAGHGTPVTIYGMAGVGKSRLAAAYADRERPRLELAWWLSANDRSTAVSGLAQLAAQMGLKDGDQERATRAAVAELSRRQGWLLVFDDAHGPIDLDGLLPRGKTGKVLITSRNPDWEPAALTLEIPPLRQDGAVRLLQEHSRDQDPEAAAALAIELDRLPLALTQSAAYCRQVGMSLADYRMRYQHSRAELLGRGTPVGYPAAAAATFQLAFRAAARQDAAAVQLLRLLAYAAPIGMPRETLAKALTADTKPAVVVLARLWALVMPRARYIHKLVSSPLPRELRRAAAEPKRLDQPISVLLSMSLLAPDPPGRLRIDQLTRELLQEEIRIGAASWWNRFSGRILAATRWTGLTSRDRTSSWSERRWLDILGRLLSLVFPNDPGDPATWPQCEALLPHADAVLNHATRLHAGALALGMLRALVAGYLYQQGQYAEAKKLNEQAVNQLRAVLGETHQVVFTATNELALALAAEGDLAGARRLMKENVISQIQVLGEDDPLTLRSVSILGGMLRDQGDLAGARELLEGTVRMRRQVLGEKHSDTLSSMNNLALVLHSQGDLVGARKLYEQVLPWCVELHGKEHPKTLITAGNLAAVLRDQEDLPGARKLYEYALSGHRRVFGEDHPQTIALMNVLANISQEPGEPTGARSLRQRVWTNQHPAAVADNRATTSERAENAATAMMTGQDDMAGARTALQQASDSGHPQRSSMAATAPHELTPSSTSGPSRGPPGRNKSLATLMLALSDSLIGITIAHLVTDRLHVPMFIEAPILAAGGLFGLMWFYAVQRRIKLPHPVTTAVTQSDGRAPPKEGASLSSVLLESLYFLIAYLALLILLRFVAGIALLSGGWYFQVLGIIPLMVYVYNWLIRRNGLAILIRTPLMSMGKSARTEKERASALLVPVASYLVYVVLFIGFLTEIFAAWTAFWYRQGFLKVQRGFPDAAALGTAERYFFRSFLDAIPILKVPATLHWDLGPTFGDWRIGVLLIAYKIVVIAPIAYGFVALLKNFWDQLGVWWAEDEAERQASSRPADAIAHGERGNTHAPRPTLQRMGGIVVEEISDLIDGRAALPFTTSARTAFRFTAAHHDKAGPIDTRDLLVAIMRTDFVDRWRRVWQETGGVEQLAALDLADPDSSVGFTYQGIPLTGTVTEAIEFAVELEHRHKMGTISPGLLALTLIANPASAAASCLLSHSDRDHRQLLTLLEEAVASTGITADELVSGSHATGQLSPTPDAGRDRVDATGNEARARRSLPWRMLRSVPSFLLVLLAIATLSAYVAYGVTIAYFVTGWLHLPRFIQVIAVVAGGVWGRYWMGSPARTRQLLLKGPVSP